LPRYFELATDINVIPAWDEIGPPTVFNGITTPGTPLDGNNVKVAVIDDGIQKNHPDLTASNIISSWNYIDGGTDPTPPANQGINHGTGAAGLIAARRDNNVGMTGIAPNAKLIGLRVTGSFLPASEYADALTWTGTYNSGSNPLADVSVFPYLLSSSSDFAALYPVVKAALKDGAEKGRGGKGMVYVVPAGNEGEYHSDTNYSELSNSLYTIAVGAVSDLGRRIIYSQPGASLQVVAPSSGEEMAPRIKTTNAVVAFPDNGSVAVPANTLVPVLPLVVPSTPQKRCLGWTVSPDEYDNLTSWTRSTQRVLTLNSVASTVTIPPSAGAAIGFNYNYGGTSASCSMVAGVTALMLQANPSLGYRDVMEILMRSARVVDPLMGEWQYNSLGIPFSHKYGAGLVDAAHAVRMAKKWNNLQSRTVLERTLPSDNITDFPALGYVKTIPTPPSFRVEQVAVRLKIQHGRRGDLGIILTSPASGQADTPVESYLMVPHREDFSQDIGNPARSDSDGIESDGEYWTFMSVHHWGTSSTNQLLGGTQPGNDWTLRVFDSTKQGIVDYATANPNAVQPENRVYCPVANPLPTAEVPIKVVSAKVYFYGSASDGLNEPPSIQTNVFPVKTNSSFSFKVQASTDLSGDASGFPRAPIYDYRLRMIKAATATTPDLEIAPGTSIEHALLYPTPVTTPADAAGKSPAYFRFDRSTGLLTNEPYLPGGQAFRPLPEGEWLVEIHATSIFGTTRRQVAFKVEKALTYPEWKALYFSVTEQAAANFDQLDPDQDGVPNLLEYTMGGIPTVKEPDLFPPPVTGSGKLEFTYKADLSAQGFRVVPQVSTNPALAWQDARNTVPPLAVLQEQEGSLQKWKVTLPMSPNKKVFFRLKAGVIP
jgi:subtilisin-like proprotein convertase family protein